MKKNFDLTVAQDQEWSGGAAGETCPALAALFSSFDPISDEFIGDPARYICAARNAPVFYSEKLGHWVVTRYSLIREILLKPEIFSAANANSPITPPCPHAVRALEDGRYGAIPTLGNVDPPEHTRVRRIVNAAFTLKRVAEMEAFIRQLVIKFCEERFVHGYADLMRDLAREIPILVLFKILGIEEEQLERVKNGSMNRIVFIYGRASTDGEQVEAAKGLAAFWRYAEELVQNRSQEPRDDFTSDLIRTKDGNGHSLTPRQVATVVLNLLFAGHETTTGILGNAFIRLLGDRDLWKLIRAEPSFIPNAVEEVLRLDSSVISWRRSTTKATTIGGASIPAGAKVLLFFAAANRDPEIFSDPDTFDIRRVNAKEHLSFGHGAHLCIGRPLARLEARIVLEEVSARFPTMRLVPDFIAGFLPNLSFRGPISVPVVWDC